jgi:ribulose-5-phosphate 4-epimerase/fuculose-1-phosphate aldolase
MKEQIKLSIAHRIISSLKMDDMTYTHISHRIDKNHFFLSPFGLLYEEVTPDNLIKINLDGEISEDNSYKSANPTGVAVHSSIYKARQNINSIIHLHTNNSIAVSVMKFGLLPISQHALHFYEKIAYHKYDSLFLNEKDQMQKIIYDMSDKNIIILNNHGFITCGKTIEEALFYAYHLEKACIIQVLTLSSCNFIDLIIPDHETCKKACDDLLSFEKNLGERDWKAWLNKLKKENINFNID